MVSLKTSYLGLQLETPLVASASPMSGTIDGIRRLEDGGVSAVVLFSVFSEQLDFSPKKFDDHPSTGDLPVSVTPNTYLELLAQAKLTTELPIIASINGPPSNRGAEYSRLLQQAGADALELNFYEVPTDPTLNPLNIEQRYTSAVEDIFAEISIPVSVKLGPNFTNLTYTAHNLAKAGADGLVIFNRFYQPDISTKTMKLEPKVRLSRSEDILSAIRWTSILKRTLMADIGVTGGVHTSEDVIKLLLAGADAVMLCSALLENGPGHAKALEHGLRMWMDEMDLSTLDEVRGRAIHQDRAGLMDVERVHYVQTLKSLVV